MPTHARGNRPIHTVAGWAYRLRSSGADDTHERISEIQRCSQNLVGNEFSNITYRWTHWHTVSGKVKLPVVATWQPFRPGVCLVWCQTSPVDAAWRQDLPWGSAPDAPCRCFFRQPCSASRHTACLTAWQPPVHALYLQASWVTASHRSAKKGDPGFECLPPPRMVKRNDLSLSSQFRDGCFLLFLCQS